MAVGAHRRDPLLERALLESDLALGSQGSALRGLLAQAAAEYTQTRKVGASNARAIIGSTQAAAPQVAHVFDQALASVNAQRAALGVGAGDPQAAAYERRVGEQKAQSLTDLIQQGARAEQGRVYAGQVARDQYVGKKSQITGELLDLAQKQGLTAQSIYGKLKDAQLQRGVTRRGQDVTAHGQDLSQQNQQASLSERQRHDRAMERNAANGPGGRGAVKWATPAAHAAAKDAIEQALSFAHQQVGVRGRAETVRLLIDGRPAMKTKNSKGEDVTLPAIPRLPADLVRAAVNLANENSLSRGDVQRLHRRGLRVRSLGYPTRKADRSALAGALATLATQPTSVRKRPPVPLGG
jgi:hypothetical protein